MTSIGSGVPVSAARLCFFGLPPESLKLGGCGAVFNQQIPGLQTLMKRYGGMPFGDFPTRDEFAELGYLSETVQDTVIINPDPEPPKRVKMPRRVLEPILRTRLRFFMEDPKLHDVLLSPRILCPSVSEIKLLESLAERFKKTPDSKMTIVSSAFGRTRGWDLPHGNTSVRYLFLPNIQTRASADDVGITHSAEQFVLGAAKFLHSDRKLGHSPLHLFYSVGLDGLLAGQVWVRMLQMQIAKKILNDACLKLFSAELPVFEGRLVKNISLKEFYEALGKLALRSWNIQGKFKRVAEKARREVNKWLNNKSETGEDNFVNWLLRILSKQSIRGLRKLAKSPLVETDKKSFKYVLGRMIFRSLGVTSRLSKALPQVNRHIWLSDGQKNLAEVMQSLAGNPSSSKMFIGLSQPMGIIRAGSI